MSQVAKVVQHVYLTMTGPCLHCFVMRDHKGGCVAEPVCQQIVTQHICGPPAAGVISNSACSAQLSLSKHSPNQISIREALQHPDPDLRFLVLCFLWRSPRWEALRAFLLCVHICNGSGKN